MWLFASFRPEDQPEDHTAHQARPDARLRTPGTIGETPDCDDDQGLPLIPLGRQLEEELRPSLHKDPRNIQR